MVDDYFDLSGDQEDWVRQRFGRLQAWHRASELPAYERDLRDAIARTERPLTVEDARWVNTTPAQLLPPPGRARAARRGRPARCSWTTSRRAASRSASPRRARKIERETAPRARRRRASEKRTAKLIDQIEGYTGRLDRGAARPRRRPRALHARHRGAAPGRPQAAPGDGRGPGAREAAPRPKMVAGLNRVLIETDTWRKPEYVAALKQRDEQPGRDAGGALRDVDARAARRRAEEAARLPHRRLKPDRFPLAQRRAPPPPGGGCGCGPPRAAPPRATRARAASPSFTAAASFTLTSTRPGRASAAAMFAEPPRRPRGSAPRSANSRPTGPDASRARISPATWSAIGPTTTCKPVLAHLHHAARAERAQGWLVHRIAIDEGEAQPRRARIHRRQVGRAAQRGDESVRGIASARARAVRAPRRSSASRPGVFRSNFTMK